MDYEEKLVAIWGRDLYNTFGHHMNEDGWLTAEWPLIIEKEIPRWDNETLIDNEEYSLAYGRMYNIDFEESEDLTLIRRTDQPTY